MEANYYLSELMEKNKDYRLLAEDTREDVFEVLEEKIQDGITRAEAFTMYGYACAYYYINLLSDDDFYKVCSMLPLSKEDIEAMGMFYTSAVDKNKIKPV